MNFITANEVVIQLVSKIEKERIAQNIKQAEFAQKTGIAYGTYRNFLDKQTISLHNFIVILQTLGLDKELNSLLEQNTIPSIKSMQVKQKQRVKNS